MPASAQNVEADSRKLETDARKHLQDSNHTRIGRILESESRNNTKFERKQLKRINGWKIQFFSHFLKLRPAAVIL